MNYNQKIIQFRTLLRISENNIYPNRIFPITLRVNLLSNQIQLCDSGNMYKFGY